jgi:hypothetical protein
MTTKSLRKVIQFVSGVLGVPLTDLEVKEQLIDRGGLKAVSEKYRLSCSIINETLLSTAFSL